MPPKGAKKAEDTPAKAKKPATAKDSAEKPKKVDSASPGVSDKDAAKRSPDTPSKASPAKRTKTAADWKHLTESGGDPTRITISYDSSLHATAAKNGTLTHQIKLESAAKFQLLTTEMLTEGPHTGCQAIIIRPASAFNFMGLPPNCRRLVYKVYFASKGVIGKEIVIEGKRKNSDMYAKAYAGGSKERVALLAVNKTINQEASDLFYDLKLRVEHPTALMTLLSSAGVHHFRKIEVVHWKNPNIRVASNLLCSANQLEHLSFEQDVTKEVKVDKAAQAFWSDMDNALNTMANNLLARGIIQARSEVIDHLEFGPKALLAKEEEYDEEDAHDFKEVLKSKLQ